MYIIQKVVGDVQEYYGPFMSADAAYDWGFYQLSDDDEIHNWTIIKLQSV